MTEDDDHPFDRARRPALAWAWSPIPSGGCRACAQQPVFLLGGRRAGRRITAPRPPDAPHGLNSPHRAGPRAGRAGAAAGDRSHRQYHHPSTGRVLSGVRYRRKSTSLCSRTASRRALTTARSTTAVRTLPWWMAGWTPGVYSAWEPWDARSRLARSRDVVAVVIERLRQDETAFLHPFGIDEECDEALASLKGTLTRYRPSASRCSRSSTRRSTQAEGGGHRRRRPERRSSPTWAGRSGERHGHRPSTCSSSRLAPGCGTLLRQQGCEIGHRRSPHC